MSISDSEEESHGSQGASVSNTTSDEKEKDEMISSEEAMTMITGNVVFLHPPSLSPSLSPSHPPTLPQLISDSSTVVSKQEEKGQEQAVSTPGSKDKHPQTLHH